MTLTGKIVGVNIDFATDVPKITLTVNEKNDLLCGYDELKDVEKLSIEIKPYRKKRSLDQNAYAWVLIGKIADKLRTSKDEVYLDMLKRYGQGGVIKVQPQNEKVILAALKYYEPHEKLYTETDKYYRIWAGSSGYNTEEMTIFVDGIISEAQELGIQTLTPDELAEMRSRESAL
jgi:hypothetical protein